MAMRQKATAYKSNENFGRRFLDRALAACSMLDEPSVSLKLLILCSFFLFCFNVELQVRSKEIPSK